MNNLARTAKGRLLKSPTPPDGRCKFRKSLEKILKGPFIIVSGEALVVVLLASEILHV